jgi:Rrf2 family protein
MARPTNTRFAVAVHALTLLADAAPASMSSEEMAGSARSNPVYVRRVLGVLRTAGLVASRPGVGGGWHLLADPATTTLADVWRAIYGGDPLLGLHETAPDCRVGRAIQAELARIDRRAAQAVEAELEGTTVAQLVARAAPRSSGAVH